MAEIGYARAIFRSGLRVWGDALLEILVVACVTLIPLLGAVIHQVLPPDSKIYLGEAFEIAFLSGQLIFYALSLIAVVVWQCNKDFKSFFPLRTIFNLYSLVCIVICSIVIGYDPELATVNRVFLAPISVIIFVTALVAYVLMAVISQVHINVGQTLAADDAALGDAVRRSRGIGP